MIKLVFASLIILGQSLDMPSGWRTIPVADTITGRQSSVFVLTGTWVGGGPSFPYKDAIPSIDVHCSGGKYGFTKFHIDALVDVNVSRVDYRVDDKAGTFYLTYRAGGGDKSVQLGKGDVQKILKGKLVILRVAAFNQGLLTAQFDMPASSQIVKDVCGLK